jgi:dihydrofolate synthase / folylpolyglutamate synthase
MLQAGGLTVHAYSSPHLVRFNERFRVAGSLITDAALAPLLTEVLDVAEQDNLGPSFFEATTAAAFLTFSRTRADTAIIEVGLGGRLDATNAIAAPAVCGIAQLGIDHEAFLGSDAVTIASEKAGVAKAGVPLVTMCYSDAINRRIADVADAAGARLIVKGRDWDAKIVGDGIVYHDAKGALETPLPALAGPHQISNAALAIAMMRHQAAIPVTDAAIATGVASAQWPGRLQRLKPGPLSGTREIWVDGAHNEAAGESLAAFFKARGAPIHLITGILSNKDAEGLLKHFKGIIGHMTAMPVPGHPCHSPEVLKAIGQSLGFECSTAHSVEEALAQTDRPVTLIAGSLYLIGEILKANDQLPD